MIKYLSILLLLGCNLATKDDINRLNKGTKLSYIKFQKAEREKLQLGVNLIVSSIGFIEEKKYKEALVGLDYSLRVLGLSNNDIYNTLEEVRKVAKKGIKINLEANRHKRELEASTSQTTTIVSMAERLGTIFIYLALAWLIFKFLICPYLNNRGNK